MCKNIKFWNKSTEFLSFKRDCIIEDYKFFRAKASWIDENKINWKEKRKEEEETSKFKKNIFAWGK